MSDSKIECEIVPFPPSPEPVDEAAKLQTEYDAARNFAIEVFLAEEATKERVMAAVQGALAAITEQNNEGHIVRIGQAAEIIVAVVLESLKPTPPDDPPASSVLVPKRRLFRA